MFYITKNLDMILSLEKDGRATMTYVEHESGEHFYYSFHFTGELGEDRDKQAQCIGYEILSWFDMMKTQMEEKEGRAQ